MSIAVDELPIPREAGATGWDDFLAAVAVQNASEAHAFGTHETSIPAERRLPHWQSPSEGGRLLVARLDGRIVARGVTRWVRESSDTAWLGVEVLPELRGRGIGTALADALEAVADEEHQTRRIVYAASSPSSGPVLEAPTGFGTVPRDNPEVRFLLTRGYRLEQVERGSRFALPGDAALLAAHRAEAEAHAGGYVVHTWSGATPDRFLTGMAELSNRMSIDAPSAGLEEPEESWDEAKVAELDARLASASHLLTSAVEHAETGQLAGYTRVSVPFAADAAVDQWDTIVRREHRGHRLGMLLKIANLQAITEHFPGHPSVLTYNAEENRPMLSVNEAVGFEPIGYQGAWRRDVPSAAAG